MEENSKELEDKQIYEVGYHLIGTLPEDEVSKEVTLIHSLISENRGNIISEGAPTLRQLAYEIAKKVETKSFRFNKAYFGWVKFELEASEILNIKKKMEAMPNVLRFLIVKTVKENTMYTPKIPMFKKEAHKEEKDGRPEEATAVSEAEIDKSIDELLVN